MGNYASNPKPKSALPKAMADVVPLTRSLFLRNMMRAIEDKGLTTELVAQESGLDRTMMRKLVRGELTPSRSVLQRLSLSPSMGLTYKTLVTWCLLDESLHYASANNPGF